MNSSVWVSRIVDSPGEEVSPGTWLQALESPVQGHGISQAMKCMKEKSGKHFLLIGVMFRSNIDIHVCSTWSWNTAIRVAGQEIINLWMQALQTTALAQLTRR